MNDTNYAYWEKALADPKALHRREFRITSEPQPGFYRTRRGDPVAIWWDADRGGIEIYIGSPYRPAPPDDYEDIWLSCAQRPVTEEAYRAVADDGGDWPDVDPIISQIGDNRGADLEGLIDDLAAQAGDYKTIDHDDEAKRAISLRAAILEQHKRADKEREEQKKPHLKAARDVDEAWMPMVKKAKKWADHLRVLVEGWETMKRKHAREAELLKQVNDVAEAAGNISSLPEPQDQIRTGYGKAVSVRERNVVTGINHLDLVLAFYRRDERLTETLIRMAQEDVNAGQAVPGVTVETQATIR